MKSPWRIVVPVLALIALAGLIAIISSNPPEPSYQGKPLSWWLEENARPPSQLGTPETAEAIRQIGTNALPTLIELLCARDSSIKKLAMKWAARQSIIKIHFIPADELRSRAVCAYARLRSVARPQVPALLGVLTNTPFTKERYSAANALSAIGPDAAEAVPALVKAAKDPDSSVRACALSALGCIHAKPDLTIPALIAGLEDSDPLVSGCASNALVPFGQQAKGVPRPF